MDFITKLRNSMTASVEANDGYAVAYEDIPFVGKAIFEQQRLLYQSLLEWLDNFESQYRES